MSRPDCWRFSTNVLLLAGATEVGDRLLVLPVMFHLLWSGRLPAGRRP
jgi:hypothetical protein